MSSKFYGIGVGPGDPELLTIKAVKILEKIDVIVAPETKSGKGSIALNIAKPYLRDDIEVAELKFPMTYEEDILNKAHDDATNYIKDLVNQGKNVAFLTLGDPMVYSTYIYLYKRLDKGEIEIETIPGITSFCAIASKVGIPLAETGENIAIIPSVYSIEGEKTKEIIDRFDNIVFMKASGNIDPLIELLDESGHGKDSVFVSRLGLDGEVIEYDINKRKGIKNNYLSTLIAKRLKNEK